MPFPFIPIALAGASIASGLYAGYQTRQANRYTMDYQKRMQRENEEFWKNYAKNHRWSNFRKVKYPYRSGYYYNMSGYYNALGSYNSSYANNMSRSFGSMAGAYYSYKKYYR